MLMTMYCYKSQTYSLTGDINEAKKAFSQADKLIDHHKIMTIYYCTYLLAKVKLEFAELKEMAVSDRNFMHQLKKLIKTSDKLISKSKKMIGSLTEAYLIRAGIHIFRQQQKKALKYLQLGISTGEKHNGRLELSRTYFETGKFLSDPQTKQNQLNGLSGNDYLEKAKALFEEMDLQWDLEQYRKYVEGL